MNELEEFRKRQEEEARAQGLTVDEYNRLENEKLRIKESLGGGTEWIAERAGVSKSEAEQAIQAEAESRTGIKTGEPIIESRPLQEATQSTQVITGLQAPTIENKPVTLINKTTGKVEGTFTSSKEMNRYIEIQKATQPYAIQPQQVPTGWLKSLGDTNKITTNDKLKPLLKEYTDIQTLKGNRAEQAILNKHAREDLSIYESELSGINKLNEKEYTNLPEVRKSYETAINELRAGIKTGEDNLKLIDTELDKASKPARVQFSLERGNTKGASLTGIALKSVGTERVSEALGALAYGEAILRTPLYISEALGIKEVTNPTTGETIDLSVPVWKDPLELAKVYPEIQRGYDFTQAAVLTSSAVNIGESIETMINLKNLKVTQPKTRILQLSKNSYRTITKTDISEAYPISDPSKYEIVTKALFTSKEGVSPELLKHYGITYDKLPSGFTIRGAGGSQLVKTSIQGSITKTPAVPVLIPDSIALPLSKVAGRNVETTRYLTGSDVFINGKKTVTGAIGWSTVPKQDLMIRQGLNLKGFEFSIGSTSDDVWYVGTGVAVKKAKESNSLIKNIQRLMKSDSSGFTQSSKSIIGSSLTKSATKTLSASIGASSLKLASKSLAGLTGLMAGTLSLVKPKQEFKTINIVKSGVKPVVTTKVKTGIRDSLKFKSINTFKALTSTLTGVKALPAVKTKPSTVSLTGTTSTSTTPVTPVIPIPSIPTGLGKGLSIPLPKIPSFDRSGRGWRASFGLRNAKTGYTPNIKSILFGTRTRNTGIKKQKIFTPYESRPIVTNKKIKGLL